MGTFKLAFFLAHKSIIKGNRWTLALIILVMSLSFANLILTPSILAGVTDALDKQQIETLYANIIIDPAEDRTYLDHVSRIEKLLAQEPDLVASAPHLNSSAYFEYNWRDKITPQDRSQSGNWHVIGIDPEKEIKVTTISNSLIEGSYLSPEDRDQILLGVEIAGGAETQALSSLTLDGAKVGNKVRLTYPNGFQREYTVKGVFKTREVSSNNLAFVTRKEMASVMGPAIFTDRANQILVRTQPGVDENEVIAELKTRDINGQIRKWQEYGGSIGGIVGSFRILASLIGGIGLIVAGTVMFIVIYINVVNRRRQIGILRAIGISRNAVFGSYIIQALLYSMLGIIIGGCLFGYVVMPYFRAYPIDLPSGLVSLTIDPGNVRNSIFWLLFAALLAGFIPVFNITRHSIIKAIWGN
jgi:putative ABC transport system permease protein